MVDLRQCKFGTLLKTRGGKQAVFICKSCGMVDTYFCITLCGERDFFTIRYNEDGTQTYPYHKEDKDIIGYWED